MYGKLTIYVSLFFTLAVTPINAEVKSIENDNLALNLDQNASYFGFTDIVNYTKSAGYNCVKTVSANSCYLVKSALEYMGQKHVVEFVAKLADWAVVAGLDVLSPIAIGSIVGIILSAYGEQSAATTYGLQKSVKLIFDTVIKAPVKAAARNSLQVLIKNFLDQAPPKLGD